MNIRHNDHGGGTASVLLMIDRDGRGPSILPRYQRGGRTGRMTVTGSTAWGAAITSRSFLSGGGISAER